MTRLNYHVQLIPHGQKVSKRPNPVGRTACTSCLSNKTSLEMAKYFSFKVTFSLPTAFKAYSGVEDAMFGFAATHAQFNRKSDIFELPIGSFQGRCFPTAGQGERRRWVRG